MKKIGMLLSFVLLSISVVFSQLPQSGGGQRITVEERAKKITEWMTTELDLTQEQIHPVDSVNLLFAKVQQSYFQAVDGDWDKLREAMITLEKEKENALSKILTEEQLENYKTKVQEIVNNRGSRGKRQ
ncbi:MAG: DUF4890 domain-containing protein [Dysgonamonadaceae bacterium]|jgi:hypothetical protein|nr:DUF4890 domain-containing protein [Dysgonamonadaceae bacterium]